MEITEQIASPDKNRDRNEAKKHTRDLFKNVFSVNCRFVIARNNLNLGEL